ncbi:glutamate 5-kinase 1 [Lysinibacillus alkalisoli]|uniref:Glutamate 5-kinase n=1 Tax=Lysinibacillus alkalisoli TaxID=1911548 RepID=A0A917G2X6_9BACI|nr:glutamate 5-kinase [Lysinibacillus alkalisoli]GGG19161.1 glutamate 5-kinase 1 [Lysinibacillus alkalisoli]
MKRIVVKIGSSSLTNAYGELDTLQINDHVQAIAQLKKAGYDVILVSSGAVAAGFKQLGYPHRPVTLKGKQAAAAVGQSLLIQHYYERFALYDITPAQLLLTRTDFLSKERYQNIYATLEELLARGLVPIINENDSVSVAELTFGDNDMLSALVSSLIHAEQCIILTDVNGLYTANPALVKDATRINHLTTITDDVLQQAEGTSKVGTGGMFSKLLAAKRALQSGVKVFIGKGQGADKLLRILAGHGDGTYIERDDLTFTSTQKQWIRLAEVKGMIYIDEGAEDALMFNGKSLLPAGVTRIEGDFVKHDVVEVHGLSRVLGRGEVQYAKTDLVQYIGQTKTKQIEVIHRNRWVQYEEEYT